MPSNSFTGPLGECIQDGKQYLFLFSPREVKQHWFAATGRWWSVFDARDSVDIETAIYIVSDNSIKRFLSRWSLRDRGLLTFSWPTHQPAALRIVATGADGEFVILDLASQIPLLDAAGNPVRKLLRPEKIKTNIAPFRYPQKAIIDEISKIAEGRLDDAARNVANALDKLRALGANNRK